MKRNVWRKTGGDGGVCVGGKRKRGGCVCVCVWGGGGLMRRKNPVNV